MNQPLFAINQQVKFVGDHDQLTGKVISFSYDSDSGYTYKVSSQYYDMEAHSMSDGIITCKEAELVDMSSYTGEIAPIIPQQTVTVSDNVTAPTADTTQTNTTTTGQTDQTTPNESIT